MKRTAVSLGLVCAAGIVAGLALEPAEVEQKDTIRKTFTLGQAEGAKRIRIDNIDGPVTYTARPGNEVEIVIERLDRAESQEKLAEARQAVKLDLKQSGNEVVAFVDAPWRCGDGINYRGYRQYGYRVRFDIQVHGPADAALSARTVNNGDVTVRGLRGDFDVCSVNGALDMSDISGSGHAHTVNGKIDVTFRDNPRSESSFRTINGTVRIHFRPGFSADLRFKTFNGSIYTDFPVSYLPARAPTQERREGKFVFKSDRFTGARVGAGGPEIRFDTLNGNIHILEKAQ